MCVITILTAVIVSVPKVHATPGASGSLGTNSALGSPVLNNNFVADSWNKWEMETWGIYLSNFAVPLVDDYESAFSLNTTRGSKGSGLKALEFGSGNDPSNNKTLENLLTLAIGYQNQTSLQPIYVKFTPIEDNGFSIKKEEPIAGEDLRIATFKDLFLQSDKPTSGVDNTSWSVFEGDASGWFNWGSSQMVAESYYLVGMREGYLPTFYVKNGSQFIEVLDYTDAWDLQIVTALLNKAATTDLDTEFYEALNDLWSNNQQIGFDAFGNIVASHRGSNKIVIPASANQHLTVDKGINILNSVIFNGQDSSLSRDKMVDRARQLDFTLLNLSQRWGAWSSTTLENGYKVGGYPAFGSKESSKLANGVVIPYFDFDTVVAQSKINGDSRTYGEMLMELMDQSIDNSSYSLKIEATNQENYKFDRAEDDAESALKNMVMAASMIPNITSKSGDSKIIKHLTEPSGNEIQIFDGPVLIPVQLETNDDEYSNEVISRRLTNFMYEAYTGKINDTTIGKIDRSKISGWLRDMDSKGGDLGEVYQDSLYRYFQAVNTDYKNKGYKADDSKTVFKLGGTQNAINNSTRFVLAYPASSTMRSVSNTLGLRDGTEFSAMSTLIYSSYLEWYGVNTSTVIGGNSAVQSSNFNELLFDNSPAMNFDITNLAGVKSKEQKEAEMREFGYLVLSPGEDGRQYRRNIAISGISDFIYEQYNRITYGKASEYYSGVSTKGGSGFLATRSINDNFFTGWFMDIYVDVVVWVIMLSIIIIILVGLIKRKKTTWFVIAIAAIVNLTLLLPSIGNITPYITNRVVNRMFDSNMTTWSVSEQIANAQVEKKAATEDDQGLAAIVNMVKNVMLDRSLVIRRDISAKVTTKLEGSYEDIQSMQSARWMLPMLIGQFTASDEDKQYDYVNIPLGDLLDDMSNMYWYYNPDYAVHVDTINANDTNINKKGGHVTLASRVSNYYTGYTNTANKTSHNSIKFRSSAYDRIDYDEMTHTYSYLMKSTSGLAPLLTNVGNSLDNYTGTETWQNYIDRVASQVSSTTWSDALESVENVADQYVRFDRNTVDPIYGYLWATEGPQHYFYNVVQDTFEPSLSLGALIGQLQGQYTTDSVTGDETRQNFMYADTTNGKATGFTKDVLDLQELFTNTIPYLYQMSIVAGGFDGESGLLGDQKITGLSYYNGMNASWLFRSNWAIKLMENKDLTASTKVRDSSGTEYEVLNPMLPDQYPSYRPMVFSEAQKEAYQLHDSDLSLIELKAIKVNKDIVRKWTTLVNQAGTSGITKEILLRQMALDATFTFNEEFSPYAIFNTKFIMYPQSLDLRSLSFDAIMKMMVINVTGDASYMYGDTMRGIIENSSIITSIGLLLAALISASIIPFIREVMLALMFYLTFLAMIKSLTADAKYQRKLTGGAVISNLLFLVITLAYYGAFSLMLTMTNKDEVLSVGISGVKTGNPGWTFLIIILLGILYIMIAYKLAKTIIQNRGDMGFELYATVIGGTLSSISNRFQNIFSSEKAEPSWSKYGDSANISSDGSGDISGETIKGDIDIEKSSDDDRSNEKEQDYEYKNFNDFNNTSDIDSSFIDEEIKRGKEMGRQEQDKGYTESESSIYDEINKR